MKYRHLGKAGIQVSELSLGSWITFQTRFGVDTAAALVDSAPPAAESAEDTPQAGEADFSDIDLGSSATDEAAEEAVADDADIRVLSQHLPQPAEELGAVALQPVGLVGCGCDRDVASLIATKDEAAVIAAVCIDDGVEPSEAGDAPAGSQGNGCVFSQ